MVEDETRVTYMVVKAVSVEEDVVVLTLSAPTTSVPRIEFV